MDRLADKYVRTSDAYDAVRAELEALLLTFGLRPTVNYSWDYIDAEHTLHINGWDGQTKIAHEHGQALLSAGVKKVVYTTNGGTRTAKTFTQMIMPAPPPGWALQPTGST